MKIINISKNTVYVDDIDYYIPYCDGKPQDIDPDLIKKSRCLRGHLLDKSMFNIVAFDENERIESSLMYMRDRSNKPAATNTDNATPEEPEEPETIPTLVSASDEIEVRIHGIFYDAGGYGKVNRNLAFNLKKMGYKVKIDPKRSYNQLSESELMPFVAMEKEKISRNHILIDSIIPSFAEMSTGAYRILYTTIESYTVPQQFVECCSLYDEIWLTSEWSATILRKYVDKPIYTVSTGTDVDLYTENGDCFDFRPNIKSFVFLSVFGWNYRKGNDVLIKAYFDEFSAKDDVSLLIMSRYQGGQTRHHRNKIKFDIEDMMKQFPNKELPHLSRYGQILAETDMPKLYRACHAFVLPSRGEGGCLPPLEASLCGLPVIMTNCSGQQGYLRADNSFMIEIDRLEEIQSGQMHLHYWDGQQFPALTSPDVHNQLRAAMRSVVDNYEEAKQRNRRLQRLIRNKFTWTHTANAAAERIETISRKLRSK